MSKKKFLAHSVIGLAVGFVSYGFVYFSYWLIPYKLCPVLGGRLIEFSLGSQSGMSSYEFMCTANINIWLWLVAVAGLWLTVIKRLSVKNQNRTKSKK